jgi:hypothetical protein
MSHAEAMGWAEYIKRNGSLNVGARLENSLASVMALMVNRTGGNKGQPVSASDFLPKRVQDSPKPISLAQAMQAFK